MRRPTSQVTYASWVFHPPTCIHVRLLGPCFKTGPLKRFCQDLDDAVPEDRATFTPRSIRRHRPGINPGCYPARLIHPDQHSARTDAGYSAISPSAPARFNGFPLNNFKHFLTLFSKFFSSFPHGTCSLSVSRQYLALEGIYLPFCTAFPNNATLRKHLVERTNTWDRRGYHPLGRCLPADLGPGCRRGNFYRLQFFKGRFSSWAIPVSLAVTSGILVSFFSSAY